MPVVTILFLVLVSVAIRLFVAAGSLFSQPPDRPFPVFAFVWFFVGAVAGTVLIIGMSGSDWYLGLAVVPVTALAATRAILIVSRRPVGVRILALVGFLTLVPLVNQITPPRYDSSRVIQELRDLRETSEPDSIQPGARRTVLT
ncbi:hypothetical protein BH23BAC4_BH23BAC4_06810 [soil metagenome]